MNTLFIMLKNVIIFVLLAVPGYLLVKGKLLSQKDSGGRRTRSDYDEFERALFG